nr:ABC transporter substrate-binding protein [Micromonospora sp. DSM 115978]
MAATLAICLAAAACSGGDGGGQTAAACDAPGYSADSIDIGFVYADTGLLGEVFRSARSGLEARIQVANETGGIHGRTIDYIWRDDRGDAGRNDQAVRDLIEIENVFGLVEATTAASGGAPYLAEHSVPVAGVPADVTWNDYN